MSITIEEFDKLLGKSLHCCECGSSELERYVCEMVVAGDKRKHVGVRCKECKSKKPLIDPWLKQKER